jgi:hypothetical protein
MSIEVNSPHNGEAVKIRPQDVGKAVRDRDGKIFYVLPRSDGSGYYAALTKSGVKDEQRAARSEERVAEAKKVHEERSVKEVVVARKQARSGGAMKWLILLALLAAATWAVTMGPLHGLIGR